MKPFLLRSTGWGLVALTFTLCLGVTARAQDDEEPAPKPAKKASTASRALTHEALGDLLEGLGYDVKPIKLDSGYQLYGISTKQDTWSFYVEVSLPGSGANIAFLAPLSDYGKLPSAQLPARVARKMLDANWDLQPNALVTSKVSKRVFLIRFVDNQGVTAAKLRTVLDNVFATIRRTSDLWSPDKWAGGEDEGQTTDATGKEKEKPGVIAADVTSELTSTVKQLLAVAKTGDQAAVTAQVKKLTLPDPDVWFRKVFDDALGTALAEDYTATRTQTEAGLVRMLLAAAEEGQDQVRVLRFTKPDSEKATGNQNKALEAMTQPVPLYSVRLIRAGEEIGLHLYSFAAVEGKLRFVGKMRAVADRKSGLVTPLGSGSAELAPAPVPISGLDAALEKALAQLNGSLTRLPAGPSAGPHTELNALVPEAAPVIRAGLLQPGPASGTPLNGLLPQAALPLVPEPARLPLVRPANGFEITPLNNFLPGSAGVQSLIPAITRPGEILPLQGFVPQPPLPSK